MRLLSVFVVAICTQIMAGLEILGAVASAAQLADICLRITESLSMLCSRVLNAPKSISQRRKHIQQLTEIARLIEHCPSLQINPVMSIVASISHQAQELNDILAKWTADVTDSKIKIHWASLIIAFKEKRIQSICTKLEGEKNTLILCIAGIDSDLLYSISLGMTKVEAMVGNVLEELPAINGTAQGMMAVFEELLTRQKEDLQTGIAGFARDVAKIKNELPLILNKVDSLDSQLPDLQKAIEHLEVSEKDFSLL